MSQGIGGNLRTGMIAVLVLVLASVAVMIGAAQLLTRISGAANLAADAQGHVWLTLNGELLRLTPAGEVEAHFDLEQLGIGTAVALAPLPDGRLWVGSMSSERLYLLAADGQRLAETAPPPSAGPIFGTFHAAYEPAADRLVVTDTQNHRLLAFSGGGQFVAAGGSELRFPNGIAADPRGGLLLADTNHHLLKRVQPDLSPAPGTITQPGPVEQDGRTYFYPWPVFVSVAPDGGSYASWHGNNLLRGVVLAYGADGHTLHTILLGAAAEPQALVARANDVLVAVKSGETFSLRRFDRQGAELGAFGDPGLQTRLAGASSRAGLLRRLQMGARLMVLLGGLGLLLYALRLRRQGDLAAAGAVVKLQREPPRGGTAVMLLSVVVIFIVIVLLQLGGTGLAVKLALDARHSGSPGLVRLALVGAPLMIALVLFGVAMAWRSTQTFLDMHTRLAQRRMQAWTPYLSGMLGRGEQVEDFGVAPSLWRARLLLLTNQRLLLLLTSAGYSRKPLWQATWHNLYAVRVLPKPWWLWLLNPVSSAVEIETDNEEKALRLYAVNRRHAQQLVEMIRSAQQRSLAATQPLNHPLAVATAGAAPAQSPPALRVALLSALLPGLGQLEQGRTRQGLGLMLVALAILSSGLLRWAIALRRFADQPMSAPVWLGLLYLVLLAYGIWDAWRYAREAPDSSSGGPAH